MAKKKTPSETTVESIRHKDKRKNIPTEELRDFIADDEAAPKTMLYPRDPSLDPQLVWKGKDEQDRQDLAVPVVPVYIQEKIHPQAIIDDLMAQRKKGKPEEQLTLFADFNLTFRRLRRQFPAIFRGSVAVAWEPDPSDAVIPGNSST